MRLHVNLLLVALVVATSCSKNDSGGAGGGGFEMPPTPVEVTELVPTTVADRFTGVGTVEPSESVAIAFEVEGRIADLPMREGERVEAGAVLARLDDSELRAQLGRSIALRDRARTELARVESLVAQQIAAPQVLDDARSTTRVTEADVALNQARAAKAIIRAPFAGVIGSRRVSPGAHVAAGDVITDLAAVDEVKVTFMAPERLLGTLVPGARVRVTTTADPDHEHEGVVTLVDPILNAGTRSARIMARIPNSDGLLRAGMSARVDVVLAERTDALAVPAEAIFAEGSQSLVFVVQDDGTVQRQPVTLGSRQADLVEVIEGLRPGQRVVRTGHQKLYPGAKVAAIDDTATRGEAAP